MMWKRPRHIYNIMKNIDTRSKYSLGVYNRPWITIHSCGFSSFEDNKKKIQALSPTQAAMVQYVNETWRQYPNISIFTLMGSEMITLAVAYQTIMLTGYIPSADLALAFGISRTIRRLRFPLDLFTAHVVSTKIPALSALEMSRLLQFDKLGFTAAPSKDKEESVLNKSLQAIPRAINKYGACYMIVARYNGILTVTCLYIGLRSGLDFQSILNSYGWSVAGDIMGAWAGAVLTCGVIYPLTICLSAILPPIIYKAIQS